MWKPVGAARALNAGLALSCLPRIALHRVLQGAKVDGDMVVRVDGVLEEAVIQLCRGQDMDVSGHPGGKLSPDW